MKDFKPLLAATAENIEDIRLPVLASVKLDGIRVIAHPERGIVSRKLLQITNDYIRNTLQSELDRLGLSHLDGEIGVGDPTDPDFFQMTTSAVRRKAGEPDFTYYLFDWWTYPNQNFVTRNSYVQGLIGASPFIEPVTQRMCETVGELLAFEEKTLGEGHEGIMTRSLFGPYKFNRSTLKEQILLKRKPFAEDEAIVIGFEERMHNANEATTNELGRTKRSTHSANMEPTGTLGALIVQHPVFGEFTIGGGKGMDDASRREIWDNKASFLGLPVTFTYQKIGTVNKPRIPQFKSFRTI